MLDAPEKNIFPDLNKRIDVSEFLNEQGIFSLPVFDKSLIEPEKKDELFSIQKITRIVTISKNFAFFKFQDLFISNNDSIDWKTFSNRF